MSELIELLGKEHRLDEINQALRNHVRGLKAPVVGALHVTCADESEWECVDSFQRYFVDEMLPSLKFAQRTPFRISNLGGRYEWGAIPVAERHFATPQSHKSFKVLLIKINTHVAVTGTGLAAQYGTMKRYDTGSVACGALHALMTGGDKPFLHDLREAFQAEGSDRWRRCSMNNMSIRPIAACSSLWSTSGDNAAERRSRFRTTLQPVRRFT